MGPGAGMPLVTSAGFMHPAELAAAIQAQHAALQHEQHHLLRQHQAKYPPLPSSSSPPSSPPLTHVSARGLNGEAKEGGGRGEGGVGGGAVVSASTAAQQQAAAALQQAGASRWVGMGTQPPFLPPFSFPAPAHHPHH